MRLIHALVPDERAEAVQEILSQENIDHVLTEEASGRDDAVLVHFPLPSQAVDSILDDLREAGLDDSYVVVANAETATTPHFTELEERFVTGQEADDSIAHEEIRARAQGMNPGARTYYAMTLLSVLVGVVGLLLDAPAIVVGSMVIAPQVGSALTASVGLAFSEREMALEGLRSQVLGLLFAVLCATLFGWVIKSAQFIPPAVDLTTISQINSRTSPGVLSLIVGVCAGAAGAFGLSTDLPVSLVGVAVAAALIPAAAAVGIGIAWGFPVVASGALVLLVVNVLSINLAGVGALWYLGYRPENWEPGAFRANLEAGRLTVTLVLVVVMVVATVGVGQSTVTHASFESSTNTAIQNVLDDPEYERLELVEIQVPFTASPGTESRPTVTVVVRRPVDEPYPHLADRMRTRIVSETGRPVVVSVQFVEEQSIDGESRQQPIAPQQPSTALPRHPSMELPTRTGV